MWGISQYLNEAFVKSPPCPGVGVGVCIDSCIIWKPDMPEATKPGTTVTIYKPTTRNKEKNSFTILSSKAKMAQKFSPTSSFWPPKGQNGRIRKSLQCDWFQEWAEIFDLACEGGQNQCVLSYCVPIHHLFSLF